MLNNSFLLDKLHLKKYKVIVLTLKCYFCSCKVKKHIPNILTLGNLFCGILAIKIGFSDHYYLAGFFVVFGAMFDFFDGFSARLLKVQGEIGKQLDSLADMVTFGVAPGVIMYSFLKFYFAEISTIDSSWIPSYASPIRYEVLIPMLAFIIPLLSAIRLAKFNIDSNQSDKFIGLPTPANALFFVFIPLIAIEIDHGWRFIEEIIIWDLSSGPFYPTNFDLISGAISNSTSQVFFSFKYVFVGLIVVFSLLLNAPIEMIALKFKTFGWKGNEIRFVFLGFCLVVILLSLLISSVFVSIPIIILLYIVLSIVNNLFKKNKNELQS